MYRDYIGIVEVVDRDYVGIMLPNSHTHRLTGPKHP